jgi:hypothetical protein
MNSLDEAAVFFNILVAETIEEHKRAVREKRAEAVLLTRIRALNNVKTFLPELGYAVYGPTTKLGHDLIEAACRAHEAGEWLSCRRFCELTEDEMARAAFHLPFSSATGSHHRCLGATSSYEKIAAYALDPTQRAVSRRSHTGPTPGIFFEEEIKT